MKKEEAKIAINLYDKFLSEDESVWTCVTALTAFEKAVVQLNSLYKTDEYRPFLAVKNLHV
jgi:hypothetical protein